MEKELDQEVIKSTQIALGKYVKRPPLSEKLLKKPPFRFLHDVITTVLKTTGFFDKLFDDDELISDNVKDRESKISFLSKVIFVLSSTTGKTLSVKPSKIVSGQEPEKTNELLQCLAQALDENLSSDKAVNQYKDNLKSIQGSDTKIKDTKPIKKGSDIKKSTPKVNDKLPKTKNDVLNKQDKEKNNDLKFKRKESVPIKGGVQSQRTSQTKTIVKKSNKDINEVQKKETKVKNSKQNSIETELANSTSENVRNTELRSQGSDTSFEKVNVLGEKLYRENSASNKVDDEGAPNTSYTIDGNDLDSTTSSNELQEPSKTATSSIIENNNIKTTVANNPQPTQINVDKDNVNLNSLEIDVNITDKVKPNTDFNARESTKEIDLEKDDSLAAIRPASNESKISRPRSVRPLSVRPSSSRPGAPRMREKVDIVDKETDNLLIGKVNIIVENTQNEEEEETSLVLMDQAEVVVNQDHQEFTASSAEHGHLVQQILESQKELSQISGKTEIEWQFGAQKAREAMNQDVEQLRFNIQGLSRIANPLGKLLDHIQEDVEVMRQELQQWSNIYEEVNKEMLKQKTLNEDALTPFHTKLKQLEGDIEEKHDKINDLKVLIHKNASRIDKLLASGIVQ